MTRILLFGVGSSLVVDYEESCARLGVEIVAVRNFPGDNYLVKCRNIISPADIGGDLLSVPFICPLFTPGNRFLASRDAMTLGLSLAPLVDPTAIVASSVEIDPGTYVNAAVAIGACTRIGPQVVINRSVSVAHHVVLEHFVSIGPGAILSGAVQVGRGALIGAGSLVLPKLRIGAGSVVAAGSVVSRNVEDRTLVAGNPARAVKRDLTDALV